MLIGWNEDVLQAAVAELSRQLGRVDRGELARQSLEEFGAVILARDADEACILTDEIAPSICTSPRKTPNGWRRKFATPGRCFWATTRR